MANTTLYEFIIRNAEAAVQLQQTNGSFPAAMSGARKLTETPIRTTSHWLAVLAFSYDQTGEDRFWEAAVHAAEYLKRDDVRPYGYTYKARESPGLDYCDGLVGQAAPIRSLSIAGHILERQDLIDLALEIFHLHPFDEELGLWERIEITGENLSFDRTLNHQLIFAAASSTLGIHNNQVNSIVERFLGQLETNLDLYSTGLIKHFINPPMRNYLTKIPSHPRYKILLWNMITHHVYSVSGKQRDVEHGYYPTNLRDLALLKNNLPEAEFWRSTKLRECLKYRQTPEYRDNLAGDVYTYGSEIPSMDHALGQLVFDDNIEKFEEWMDKFVSKNYDSESNLLTANTVDPMLQAPAITYLVEFPNVEIELPYTAVQSDV